MTNLEEETVSAYLYPNTKKVAIVYNNEPLITYELDEIDVTNKKLNKTNISILVFG